MVKRMNEKSRISLGPGAASLTLIFVMLGMSILGMLSLMSGRSDEQLSRRSIEVAEIIYSLNGEAEEAFAGLDALLEEAGRRSASEEEYLENIEEKLESDFFLEGREISWTIDDGRRTLNLMVEIQPLGSFPRVRWKQHSLETVSETEESWDW